MIQLSPPLIAGPEQFEEIESILRSVLTEAGERMHVHHAGLYAGARLMLSVRELLRDLDVRLLAGDRGIEFRSDGCTSPSCSTRRPGCPAVSCS